jgi:hypothetical protein
MSSSQNKSNTSLDGMQFYTSVHIQILNFFSFLTRTMFRRIYFLITIMTLTTIKTPRAYPKHSFPIPTNLYEFFINIESSKITITLDNNSN